jgi:hypothetical protein
MADVRDERVTVEAVDAGKLAALRAALVALTERLESWSDEVLGTPSEFAAGEAVEDAREAVVLAAGAVAVPLTAPPPALSADEAREMVGTIETALSWAPFGEARVKAGIALAAVRRLLGVDEGVGA